MKQVTMKRMIMKIIDDHLRSSLSSKPSKRNVAIDPPIIAKAKRNQKRTLVRFLVIFCCSSDTTGSVEGVSGVSEDGAKGTSANSGSGSGSVYVSSGV